MEEPSRYRGHGHGEEPRRGYSNHRRPRGEEDSDDVDTKYDRRRYDNNDGYDNYERKTGGKRDDGSRRRSRSPQGGSRREGRRGSRHGEYRRRDEQSGEVDNSMSHTSTNRERISRSNGSLQREGRHPDPTALDSRSDRPARTHTRSRSTSSTRHHRNHHRHRHHHNKHRRSSTHSPGTPDELPFGARFLVRSDLGVFKPLFAHYLEVQKDKDIATLDEREIRGRWKSFVGKWNRGELAEGWYRPEMLAEAKESWDDERAIETAAMLGERRGEVLGLVGSVGDSVSPKGIEDDDDGYGPTLPPAPSQGQTRDPSDTARSTRHGPGIPSLQDLAIRRENAEEEHLERVEQLRLARKADRAEQKAQLEDLVPRAEAGTRERQLEKKREVNEKMRGFRERSPGGAAEVGEAELLGGGDSLAEYRAAKKAAERRKSEREIRREEEARAKMAEREERVRRYREREEGTMEVLREIARRRFG
ncbi:hypothetical protein AAE478_007665 [Parahypoxylon ruwenzoriense]